MRGYYTPYVLEVVQDLQYGRVRSMLSAEAVLIWM